MASTNTMLKQCEGLIDTTDINDWENRFLKNIWDLTNKGNRPDRLTDAQLESLERIWRKHFA